jgi:four helix bundle protein
MRDHRKLRAFQLADEIAIMVYRMTRTFPPAEMYGLASQMRRAAVSVPSNIVEGCARESQADYLRFLGIAFGSLRELHYQFNLSERLGYLRKENMELEEKLEEAERVLGALLRSLRKQIPSQP